MKSLARAAINVGLLGVAVAACVPRPVDTTPVIETIPRPTTTLAPIPDVATVVVGTTERLTNVDSADAYALHDWEVLGNISQGLMSFQPGTTQLTPGIAEGFEVSDDGRIYTFHLRQGIFFGDGSELTAAGYVTHIERMLSLDGPDQGGRALGEPFVASAEALDERTVVFHLHDAFAFFPAVSAGALYHPSDPNLPTDSIVELVEAPIQGVGPWMITSYEVGGRTVLEPNPSFSGEPPRLERVVISYYGSDAELVEALATGEIDVAWPGGEDQELWQALLESDPGVIAGTSGGGPVRQLILNHGLAPTDVPEVRKAIAASVDRDELAAIVGGSARPLYSPIPPGFLGANDAFADRYASPDVPTARQLLEAAGYSEAEPLNITLNYPADRYGPIAGEAMSALASQLEATGLIRAEVRATPWETYVLELTGGETYSAGLFGWMVDYFDPHPFVEPFISFGGLGTNTSDRDTGVPSAGLSEPDLIAAVGRAASTTDPSERAAAYAEVQRLYAEDVVTVPLWWEPRQVFYRQYVSADPAGADPQALNIGPSLFLDYSGLQIATD